MELTIIGCGDAFGSGGRLNTCFHVAAEATTFLIDCGATTLPALKARGIDRNAISAIFVTHFHGDHFGGIPFFILDAQFFAKRTAPLTITGPHGLAAAYSRAMETAFPGSASAKRKFDVQLVELTPGAEAEFGSVRITPRLVRHGPVGGPFFAYRIACDGRVLAYSGDTEWVEELVETGKDADLFICEAYFYDRQVPLHLDYRTLAEHLPRIGARRVLLTHMNEDMLAHAAEVPEDKAEDGMVIAV